MEFRQLDDLGSVDCAPAPPNSTGQGGTLSAWGSPYVQQNLLELRANSLPSNQFGYLLASQSPGFVAMPGGSQGNLCLGGSIARFVQQILSTGAGGSFEVPVDLSRMSLVDVCDEFA